MALPESNISLHLLLWVASFQIFTAKLEEKWSCVLCINMLITSQCENRNAEEKHLALNFENVMSTTEPIWKLLIWLYSAPHMRKVLIILVSSPTCSLFVWWMLQTVCELCAPLPAKKSYRTQCSLAGTLQVQVLVSSWLQEKDHSRISEQKEPCKKKFMPENKVP